MKILILPCAGGTSLNYREFYQKCKDVIIYEYPGHWSRIDEAFKNSIEDLAKSVVEWYSLKISDKEVVILGHSMGAVVGYEAIKYFLCQNIKVKKLCVAACCTPKKLCATLNIEKILENDAKILCFLKSIRQNVGDVVESSFFKDNLLPSIKNDFQLLNKYGKEKNEEKRENPINIPIIGFYGNNDPLVNYFEICEWKLLTTQEACFFKFSGDHFFVNKYVDKILQIIWEYPQ